MTSKEQQAHANAIRLEIIKEKEAEIEKLRHSLNNRKEAYVKDAMTMPKGTKVIIQPKYGAKFYGEVECAYFDHESEFDFVRYGVRPLKKGWVKPEGYNRRRTVFVTMKSEILHVESKCPAKPSTAT